MRKLSEKVRYCSPCDFYYSVDELYSEEINCPQCAEQDGRLLYKYNLHLPVGDTSGDGHGHYEDFYVKMTHNPTEVMEAYKKTFEKTGISLFSQEVGYDDRKNSKYCIIAVDCEDNNLCDEQIEHLSRYGFPLEWFDEYSDYKENEESTLTLYPEDMIVIFFWCVEHSLPDFQFKTVTLDVSFPWLPKVGYLGYGVFIM